MELANEVISPWASLKSNDSVPLLPASQSVSVVVDLWFAENFNLHFQPGKAVATGCRIIGFKWVYTPDCHWCGYKWDYYSLAQCPLPTVNQLALHASRYRNCHHNTCSCRFTSCVSCVTSWGGYKRTGKLGAVSTRLAWQTLLADAVLMVTLVFGGILYTRNVSSVSFWTVPNVVVIPGALVVNFISQVPPGTQIYQGQIEIDLWVTAITKKCSIRWTIVLTLYNVRKVVTAGCYAIKVDGSRIRQINVATTHLAPRNLRFYAPLFNRPLRLRVEPSLHTLALPSPLTLGASNTLKYMVTMSSHPSAFNPRMKYTSPGLGMISVGFHWMDRLNCRGYVITGSVSLRSIFLDGWQIKKHSDKFQYRGLVQTN